MEKQWNKGDKVTPIQGCRKGVIGVVLAGNDPAKTIFTKSVTVDLDGIGRRPMHPNNLKRIEG